MPSFACGFKIIIAGGGIAGLTLAIALEKFNIDYVLLEAYKEIAPPVGASIGLFPNGLLLLDQLGLYEAIRDLVPRDYYGLSHGYPMLFFDRQWLLQLLYDHIQHKDRVLLQKQVLNIESGPSGVIVKTKDGSTYHGDMIVGADGIHSAVRNEMFRIVAERQPDYLQPLEQETVPAYYQCNFGIAKDVAGWEKGANVFTTGYGRSFLVASGPGNRVFWFLFVKLPETKYGKEIPKYTKEDEAAFIKEHATAQITEDITLGDVYAKRISSTLTPLHEVVFKKWFFQRIVLLGDSVHKPNPLSGQGGNGAIETVAELVNALLAKQRSRAQGLENLSTEDIVSVFQQVQDARHKRAEYLVSEVHTQQALLANEKPWLSTILLRVLGPLGGDKNTFSSVGERLVGTSYLHNLPVPRRPRLIPYDFELPEKPVASTRAKWTRAAFVAGMGLVIWSTGKAFRLPIDEVGDWGGIGPMTVNLLGQNRANEFLKVVTSVITYPLLDANLETRTQLVYFLSQLISPILMYTIEGYRAGNAGTPLALPMLFNAGMQVQGIGRIAPLHALLSAVFGFEGSGGRFVKPEVAKALIPALSLGYILPTVMMFIPTKNTHSWQTWAALWQFAPPLVTALTGIISSVLGRRQRRAKIAASKGTKEETEDALLMERYEEKDTPILQSVYDYAFYVQALAHIGTFAYAYAHPEISPMKLLFGVPNIFKKDWALGSLPSKLSVFFKFDMIYALTGIVSHNLYAIWDLRRSGYITTPRAVKAAMGVLVGQFVVGSGATWAGLWRWRESVLSGAVIRA
ncbi:hypothetical protein M426DRAFT_73394 [Hypoxylon sp. CI-4A]|nr:hypothetical protein M426DRAFT_73394 [Hypoxylon sp. CI-4A]